jgi:Cu/Ag efflux protein CusF
MRKIALALTLLVGTACQTTGKTSERTASATDQSTETSTAQASTTGQTGETTPGTASGQGSVDPYSTSSTDSSASAGASGTATGSASGSTDMGMGAGAAGAAGTMGSSSGTMSGDMPAGGDLKAHESDDMVSGTVQKVSKKSIAIQGTGGQMTSLQLVPETLVTVDGQDAKPTQLREGQEVRASFNTVGGKQTAVKIEAIQA